MYQVFYRLKLEDHSKDIKGLRTLISLQCRDPDNQQKTIPFGCYFLITMPMNLEKKTLLLLDLCGQSVKVN